MMDEEQGARFGLGKEALEHNGARERGEEDPWHLLGAAQHQAIELRAEVRLHPVAPRSPSTLVGRRKEATERRIRRRFGYAEEPIELLDELGECRHRSRGALQAPTVVRL